MLGIVVNGGYVGRQGPRAGPECELRPLVFQSGAQEAEKGQSSEISNRGNPPALPGDSQSLTDTGVVLGPDELETG
jgi:hypothetical protein